MADDWKEKYFQLIEQHDNDQTVYQQRLEILRRGLVQVSLAADGLDHQLDHQSDQLRDLLRDKNCPTESISDALIRIDQEIARVDQLKHSSLQGLRQYSQQLIELLPEQTTTYFPYTEDLKLLQLPELLIELLKIHPNHLSSDNHELADLSQEPASTEQMTGVILAHLTDLLNQLPVAEKFETAAQKLSQKLLIPVRWHEIEDIFRDLTELILSIVGEEQQSFENYLISLSSQLKELGQQLLSARDSQDQQSHLETRLHEKLDQGFSHIQQQLREQREIGSLKHSVQQQLQSIEQAVTEFKAEHLVIEQALREQLDKLSRQMRHIEANHEAAVRALEQQRSRAMTDSLTGLPNRGAWESRITEECDRVKRYGTELTILVADVDHFKRINDSYGHLTGDKVLKILASQMRRHFRQSDFIARYGGEEFVILMPETRLEDAYIAANNVREKIAHSHFHFKGEPVQITVSFGISTVDKKDTKKTAFEKADKALYMAKQKGRNRVEPSC
ncbi:GGDEF domain-containing protein [Gynuella sunshinyii]|uniref:diguanylate cyclase n=1 Tax=Gynuella sunshinyii YC6258 TaxID=1445510 RepID=A0A0C5VRQ2_9GAMM|nr:diguanylate cyclase [Gynuella sunshinyii]AJQ92949.1 GGDEF domain [Gynuella sunshinyii YC6258]